MLAPRVNAAGRMSTPDIATRLLLATDEAMAEEARGLAQQLNDENLRRQQEEAELVAQARKAIETDPAVGAHNVLVVGGDRLAPRRHRHRRVEAGRHLPQAGDRPLDRRRRRARLVPQHPGLRHARRARALRRRVRPLRRPQAGGRPDDGGGAGAGVPRPHQRLRRCRARARSAPAAAAHRRAAQPQGDHAGPDARPRRRSVRSAWATRGRCSMPARCRSSTARDRSRNATCR